jgi:hypothetical protein
MTRVATIAMLRKRACKPSTEVLRSLKTRRVIFRVVKSIIIYGVIRYGMRNRIGWTAPLVKNPWHTARGFRDKHTSLREDMSARGEGEQRAYQG